MSLAQLAPSWFIGYDILLEGLFAIITIGVALLAYKIYKNTGTKQVRHLSVAFLFIAISYILQSLFNAFAITQINESICSTLKVQNIYVFQMLGNYFQMLFMMVGLVILLYMTLKVEKQRILWFLLALTVLPLLLFPHTMQLFFFFATVTLGFILWHFIGNYKLHRQSKTLLITLAFLFLFIGKAHFLFAVNHQLFYVLGHILELIAYILILTNLILVLKK
jgi:hypothetical protein